MWNTTNQMFKNYLYFNSLWKTTAELISFAILEKRLIYVSVDTFVGIFSINIAIVFNAFDDFMKRIL